MDHVLVGWRVALFVVYVPAEGFEKRVDELAAGLGLVVGGVFVGGLVGAEELDESFYLAAGIIWRIGDS
ncbi:MAG: hypothetical protein ACYC0L_00690 [Thermoleophilia bacterium]